MRFSFVPRHFVLDSPDVSLGSRLPAVKCRFWRLASANCKKEKVLYVGRRGCEKQRSENVAYLVIERESVLFESLEFSKLGKARHGTHGCSVRVHRFYF